MPHGSFCVPVLFLAHEIMALQGIWAIDTVLLSCEEEFSVHTLVLGCCEQFGVNNLTDSVATSVDKSKKEN